MLSDGAFLIEFYRRHIIFQDQPLLLQDPQDPIFSKERLVHGVFLDMIKMENQIPFFVLQSLAEEWFGEEELFRLLKYYNGLDSEYKMSTTKGSAFPIKSAAGKLFSADISQFYMIKNSSNNTLFLFSVAALKLGAKGLLNSFSADITVLKTLTTISSHQNRITANGDSSHYDFTHCKNDIP
ncbi:hypothetical protein QYF36_026028 [Acer negundo]|nr:hypothetical protein QYF36_026028 [Acer negundo]